MIDVAEVKIWGQKVGAVRWLPDRQLATFQYEKKFLETGYELSPLKMPLKSAQQIFSFPELRKGKEEQNSTFKGLPGLLADTLPDKYGNLLIDVWLTQNNRPPNSMNPVEQLCFIGDRGMGALEFEPSHAFKKEQQSFGIEIKSLIEIAQSLVSKRQQLKVNLRENQRQAMHELLKIGTSAGGARPKAVIAYNKKTAEVRSGQTSIPEGFEHWLIKLDGVSDTQFGATYGYGRVEYAYYLMASACGINMMECELLEENERAHFMTKRFDRDGHNTKHHIQTFCGLQHFDYTHLMGYSYEQLFQTMRILKLDYQAAEQMFRRMVFNVMATNYDDHSKNFSFRLKQNSRWELTPAYDICYAYDPENIWVNRHTLSINGKHLDIHKSDLLGIAHANNIKKGEKIIDEIRAIVCNWSEYAQKAQVSKKLSALIAENLVAFKFK